MSMWPFHIKAFDHRAKATEKNNFVIPSEQKKSYSRKEL